MIIEERQEIRKSLKFGLDVYDKNEMALMKNTKSNKNIPLNRF